jgi:hypothetical protein
MWLDVYVTLLLWVVGVPVALYAFVHALRQRADAFTAANKQTKVIWGAITGVAALVMFFTEGPFFLSTGPPGFLWLIGLIAVLVYLVDVRPRVVEIQQGRW